jgi:hypothetical protein
MKTGIRYLLASLPFKAILAKLEPESVPASPYPAPNEHFAGSGTPGVLGALPGYALSWCRCARLLDTEKAASGLPRGFWLDTAAALFAAGLDAMVNWLATGRLTEA